MKKSNVILALTMFLVLSSFAAAFSLQDVGSFFGISVNTGNAATTGVSIYDRYAGLFDFLIFTTLFVAIAHIAFSKVFGDDFKKAGAGNAIKALTLVVGAALSIAALKAGLSVSFFIPFVKNLIFFIIMVTLYFLFVRMGMKSKILAWIFAVIVTILLFNVTSILLSNKSGGLPSFGGIGGLPDLGGTTKVITESTNSAGNWFSRIFSSGAGKSGATGTAETQNTQNETQKNAMNAYLEQLKQQAVIECNVQITEKDTYQDVYKKLKASDQTFENNYKSMKEIGAQEKITDEQYMARCRELETLFSNALNNNTITTVVNQDTGKSFTPEEVNGNIKGLAYSIRKECEMAKIENTDTYGTMLIKLNKALSDYRNSVASGRKTSVGPNEFYVPDQSFANVGQCEEYESELNTMLLASPGYTNEVVAFEQVKEPKVDDKKTASGNPAINDAISKSGCKVNIPKGATDEQIYQIYVNEIINIDKYFNEYPNEKNAVNLKIREECVKARDGIGQILGKTSAGNKPTTPTDSTSTKPTLPDSIKTDPNPVDSSKTNPSDSTKTSADSSNVDTTLQDSSKTDPNPVDSSKTNPSDSTNTEQKDSTNVNPSDSTNTNQNSAGKQCITAENEAYVMSLSISKRMSILSEFQNLYPDQKNTCPGSVDPKFK